MVHFSWIASRFYNSTGFHGSANGLGFGFANMLARLSSFMYEDCLV